MEKNNDKEINFKNNINDNKNTNSNTLLKSDIQIIINILTISAKRGTFTIDEFKIVSDIYDKLKLLN